MRQSRKTALAAALCALVLALRLLLPWPAVERVLFGQVGNRVSQAFSALCGSLEQSASMGQAAQVFYMEITGEARA